MNETWTLPGQIARLALERPDRKALIEMGPDGGWVSTSWGEYWQTVRDLAKGLISLGMQSGDGVALVGNNRRDWVISQMGISAATGVPAPIYVTNTVDQDGVHHQSLPRQDRDLRQSRAAQQVSRTALDRGLIELEHIITMDALDSEHAMVTSLADMSSFAVAWSPTTNSIGAWPRSNPMTWRSSSIRPVRPVFPRALCALTAESTR